MRYSRKHAFNPGFMALAALPALRAGAGCAGSLSAPRGQVYEPAYFARFAPKTAADMVGNIPGFNISGND